MHVTDCGLALDPELRHVHVQSMIDLGLRKYHLKLIAYVIGLELDLRKNQYMTLIVNVIYFGLQLRLQCRLIVSLIDFAHALEY